MFEIIELKAGTQFTIGAQEEPVMFGMAFKPVDSSKKIEDPLLALPCLPMNNPDVKFHAVASDTAFHYSPDLFSSMCREVVYEKRRHRGLSPSQVLLCEEWGSKGGEGFMILYSL